MPPIGPINGFVFSCKVVTFNAVEDVEVGNRETPIPSSGPKLNANCAETYWHTIIPAKSNRMFLFIGRFDLKSFTTGAG